MAKVKGGKLKKEILKKDVRRNDKCAELEKEVRKEKTKSLDRRMNDDML